MESPLFSIDEFFATMCESGSWLSTHDVLDNDDFGRGGTYRAATDCNVHKISTGNWKDGPILGGVKFLTERRIQLVGGFGDCELCLRTEKGGGALECRTDHR